MKKVVVSVPGKIHLMGEHAVVHGKPALIAAINRRLTVTIEENTSPGKDVPLLTIVCSEPDSYIRYAITYVLTQLHASFSSPVTVTIRSAIPAGYHLGSSAAIAVGVSGAVSYYVSGVWNPIRINELAYEIEKKQHGNPSGGDNTTVTMGGFIWFRKELDFLKSIWQFPLTLTKEFENFYLADSGKPEETTGEMIASVSAKVAENPKKMEWVFSQNEAQTRAIATALKHGQEHGVFDAIQKGEHTLEEMGVVSASVRSFIRKVEKSGGAAKILGGGGKKKGVGFVLCYHKDATKLKELGDAAGYQILPVTLGADGVRLEQKG